MQSFTWSAVRTVVAVWLVAACTNAAPASASQAPFPSIDQAGCVVAVGDLNGDGVSDHAASTRDAKGSPVAYVFFGPDPLPEIVDVRTAALVLRGPHAVPFSCRAAASPLRSAIRSGGTDSQDAAERSTGPLRSSTGRRASPIDRPIRYTMIDLEPLMPGHSEGFSGIANDINENGAVVGRFFSAEGERAFAYSAGELRDLGTLGGHISDARGVNDTGLIVGYSLTGEVDDSGFVQNAFVSDGTVMRDLGIRWSAANAVNNAGQIVGEMRVSSDAAPIHGFLLENGTSTDLGALPALPETEGSSALSINGGGQVVGSSTTSVAGIVEPAFRHVVTHAFLYENGAMRDLGTLGKFCRHEPEVGERCRDDSIATDVNNKGVAVGFSTTPADAQDHAFATNGETAVDLGTLGGSASWAYSVNDSGQVVGMSLDADELPRPFLIDGGVMYDLNALIPDPSGPLPFAAYAINNFGQIVGNHHLLNPEYDSVSPGSRDTLTLTATLGDTFQFEYWLAQDARPQALGVSASPAACARAPAHGPRLEVRVESTSDRGKWMPAVTLDDCGSSTEWQVASVALPPNVDTTNLVHIRVRSAKGPAVVYLRRFTTGQRLPLISE